MKIQDFNNVITRTSLRAQRGNPTQFTANQTLEIITATLAFLLPALLLFLIAAK